MMCYNNIMDQKSIQAEIKKNLVLEGYLQKRSKFLKEWRKRWVVLTSNFVFTFTNKKLQEMTDVVEVKEIIGVKSYVKKEDDLTPTSFKIESTQNVLHFMAKDTPQKWAWMVTVERLVDFKTSNYSECKSIQDVKNLGFNSLNSYLESNPSAKSELKEQGEEKKEEEEEIQQIKSQTEDKMMKMINLVRSQQTENRKLFEQLLELTKNLTQKCAEEEQIEMAKRVHEQQKDLFKSDQQIQGMLKGMLIHKKLQQEKVNMKEIISEITKDTKSETAQNWASQLKQLY